MVRIHIKVVPIHKYLLICAGKLDKTSLTDKKSDKQELRAPGTSGRTRERQARYRF